VFPLASPPSRWVLSITVVIKNSSTLNYYRNQNFKMSMANFVLNEAKKYGLFFWLQFREIYYKIKKISPKSCLSEKPYPGFLTEALGAWESYFLGKIFCHFTQKRMAANSPKMMASKRSPCLIAPKTIPVIKEIRKRTASWDFIFPPCEIEKGKNSRRQDLLTKL